MYHSHFYPMICGWVNRVGISVRPELYVGFYCKYDLYRANHTDTNRV